MLLLVGCREKPVPSPVADAASHDTGLVQALDAAAGSSDASLDDASTPADGGDAQAAPEAGQPVVSPSAAVGLNPATDPNPATVQELLLADLEVLAVGSRARSLAYEQVIDADGALTPRADAWSRGSVQLLVTMPIASEIADDEEWKRQWGETVDRLFEQSLEVSYLVLGEPLDSLWPAGDAGEQERLFERALHALAYVREHPLRQPETRIGVNASVPAWAEPEPWLSQLAKRADVVSGRWFVADEQNRARPPEVALQTLRLAMDTARRLGRPFVLEQVSYPHAEAWGSSPQHQAEFFGRLFEHLAPRQEQLPFVAVTALDELDAEACADSPLQYVRTTMLSCGIGLRDRQGDPRPAFDIVIEALARFSSSSSSGLRR